MDFWVGLLIGGFFGFIYGIFLICVLKVGDEENGKNKKNK